MTTKTKVPAPIERPIDEWEIRKKLDEEKHLQICQVCRDGLQPNVAEGESLFAVKNITTREFIHVISEDGEAAIAKLEWAQSDVGYVLPVIVAGTKKHMSQETKQHLKDLNKQHRVAKKQIKQARDKRLEEGVLDKVAPTCYDGKDQDPERKEGGDMTFNGWVKEFMDGHVLAKTNGKMTMDPKALFHLAKVNALDVKKYESRYKPQDAGRVRMTIGNMLRGAASRRHKLLTPGGKSTLVPSKFVEGDPTEDIHGKRISKSA